MNNPLDRKMFRQAGMSKQPMGILASSPELMTTAQKAMASGQPIKAQNAVSVNTQATTGFGLNNQPYIPFQQQKVDPRIRTKSGAPSPSLQNYIKSMTNAIKTKEERVIPGNEFTDKDKNFITDLEAFGKKAILFRILPMDFL